MARSFGKRPTLRGQPRAHGQGALNPSCVRLRPNCQRATSKTRDAGTSQRPAGLSQFNKVRGSGRCGLHVCRTPPTGSRFGTSPLPSTFITTPNSFACQAKASARVHPPGHRPPCRKVLFPLYIFYDVPQCPAGDLRRWNQNIGWVVTERLASFSPWTRSTDESGRRR